jgi:hypothetical protein
MLGFRPIDQTGPAMEKLKREVLDLWLAGPLHQRKNRRLMDSSLGPASGAGSLFPWKI